MNVDCLIVGQGICGTFLSYELEQAELSFLVIDDVRVNSASRVASGVINPVTGRRIVKTWMIDELLPFALRAYQQIGALLNIECVSLKNVIDFFPTPQMRLSFLKRFEEGPQYLQLPTDENSWLNYFQYHFGFGEIGPCWLIDLHLLLLASRDYLVQNGRLLEERFSTGELHVKKDGVVYRDIHAKRIVFCDGISSASAPWFEMLPFAPNKGEALIVKIDELPPTHIYKKGISIVPWSEGLFWVGSSYEWSFANDLPSPEFRAKTEQVLKEWVRLPFATVDHLVSVRPATLERRPFVGFHPSHPAVGLFNGMGTKGCSLAPYFGRQLARHIAFGEPLLPEADINRFQNVLSRSSSSR